MDSAVRVRGNDRLPDAFFKRVCPSRKILVRAEQLPVPRLLAIEEYDRRRRDQDHHGDQDHDVWRRIGHISLSTLSRLLKLYSPEHAWTRFIRFMGTGRRNPEHLTRCTSAWRHPRPRRAVPLLSI